jgi:hypothetical protein
MTLAFPNPSRSFDSARNAIRFVGHDGMFEIRFFVEAAALLKLFAIPNGPDASESASLASFDALRASIHDVAREAYANKRQTSYTLTASDFDR